MNLENLGLKELTQEELVEFEGGHPFWWALAAGFVVSAVVNSGCIADGWASA